MAEESRTRVGNYEEQLSVMSDLLADMNSRLAAQADTIHQLRSEHRRFIATTSCI